MNRALLALFAFALLGLIPIEGMTDFCSWTGDWEHDQKCRDMQNQERELQDQKKEIQRMQAEMQRMRQQQSAMQVEMMESDPSFIALSKTNPDCANAIRIWQTKQITHDGNEPGGVFGKLGRAISGKSSSKALKASEKQMNLICGLPDPECEEAKTKRAALGTDASDRKKRKAEKKVREACDYLEREP